MQWNRETNGSDGMQLPGAKAMLDAQRAATENATRMANAAFHYAVSINRTWLDLWDSRLDEYLGLPKQFVNAQADFIEQAFDHYQESMQKLSSLAAKATYDAESTVREAQSAGEQMGRQLQSEAKEMAWGNRPKENPMNSGTEERREPSQHGSH